MRGGKREGAGRKTILSIPLPNHTIRCNDEEYEKVKEFLKQLRNPQK
jgi:hypothetical protein